MKLKNFCLITVFLICPCISYTSLSQKSLVDDLSKPSYFNYSQLTEYLQDVSVRHPNMVMLHSIGKSVQNRNIWAVEISENVKDRRLLKPMVKYVANIHGDEAVGRQLLIYFVDYLIGNYGKILRITKLINETDIFLVPSVNPDGFETSQVCLNLVFFTYIALVKRKSDQY